MINIDNTHIYKGISFSPFRLSSTNYKLGITVFLLIIGKMVGLFGSPPKKKWKNLGAWKGNFLTIGGKVTLVNSCLANVPYT
jgi:hypothetical protein